MLLRRADADRFIGEADMQAVAVGFGIHGDGTDAEIAAGADDAQRDLAAIGNQELSGTLLTRAGSRTEIRRIRPAAVLHQLARRRVPRASDSISFISFIDSMMQSTCPRSHRSPTFTKGGEPGEGAS